jgi:hypothetical protein
LVGVYRIIGIDRHGSRSQPKPEKTMMKRTEPATPAEISYWIDDAATLITPKILITLKQCLRKHEEAVRTGDDMTREYISTQICIYANEYGRRQS